MLAIEGAMRARELAAKDLTRIQLHVVSAQGQLDQLEHYAADTEARWGNLSRTQTTAELMRHHYQFLDRLHHAIGRPHRATAEGTLYGANIHWANRGVAQRKARKKCLCCQHLSDVRRWTNAWRTIV